MKKILLSVLCGAIILGGACSKDTDSKDSTSKKTTKETSESTQVLSKEEFEKMHSNPKEYKGKRLISMRRSLSSLNVIKMVHIFKLGLIKSTAKTLLLHIKILN